MKIKILAHTPNPERVIALAGKLCYSQVGIDELNDKISDEQVEKFITKLSDMGHMSPFEHASFTFAIEGISRNCSHQIVRHRLASFSQQSQRYVKMKGEYVVPPYIYWHEELLLEFNSIVIFSKILDIFLSSSLVPSAIILPLSKIIIRSQIISTSSI